MSDETTNGLSKVEVELLAILAEECGEVVQRIGKILRFGFRENPWVPGQHNRTTLEQEVGDIFAALSLLEMNGEIISLERITDFCDVKLDKFAVPDGRLRHAVVLK